MIQLCSVQRLGVLAVCGAVAGCTVATEPLTQADYSARSASDLKLIGKMEYVPTGPITLNQAVARAVAFNLQRRVKEIEREIEDAKLQTQSIDLLPSLDIEAARNSTSEPLSLSDSPLTRTASAGITWNILDLGVSYARAKQQSDEVLVARENERKALQDITRDVRKAYWRAVGAQRLMGKVQAIARNIKVAMRESRAMERSGANDVALHKNARGIRGRSLANSEEYPLTASQTSASGSGVSFRLACLRWIPASVRLRCHRHAVRLIFPASDAGVRLSLPHGLFRVHAFQSHSLFFGPLASIRSSGVEKIEGLDLDRPSVT